MECHYHVGRAAVYKKDCTMRNLAAVKEKDAVEAVELWEGLTDQPLTGCLRKYQHTDDPGVRTPPPCSAQGRRGLRPGPWVNDDEGFSPILIDEEAFFPKFAPLLEMRPTCVEEEVFSPKFSTIPECGASPDLSDEDFDDVVFSTTSSVPSLEEKKHASTPVNSANSVESPATPESPVRQVMSDAPSPSLLLEAPPRDRSGPGDSAPSAPALEAPPGDSPRLEKYVVFSSHSVQGRRKNNNLFTRCMIKLRVASKREVILDNEEAGYVTSNVLSLAQKQIEVVKYFWQDWHDKSPKVTQDCISLFAGTFTHADYADVYADLAEFILTNPVFTKTQSKLLDTGCALRDTVVLRVQQLIADHPEHGVFSARQSVLSNTITFINNQLLLRGLIDEARKPRQIAPAIVDFRKEAVSKTSLSPARHSKFAARRPLLIRSTRSTAVSAW